MKPWPKKSRRVEEKGISAHERNSRTLRRSARSLSMRTLAVAAAATATATPPRQLTEPAAAMTAAAQDQESQQRGDEALKGTLMTILTTSRRIRDARKQ